MQATTLSYAYHPMFFMDVDVYEKSFENRMSQTYSVNCQ